MKPKSPSSQKQGNFLYQDLLEQLNPKTPNAPPQKVIRRIAGFWDLPGYIGAKKGYGGNTVPAFHNPIRPGTVPACRFPEEKPREALNEIVG